jgi:hypothetical protein
VCVVGGGEWLATIGVCVWMFGIFEDEIMELLTFAL